MTSRPTVEAGLVTVDELAHDPHPHLARLREAAPVAWIPALNGWLVTRRDLGMEVLRDAATFTVDDARFSTARVVGPSMLSADGVDHARQRAAFAAPFRQRSLEPAVASIEAHVAGLIETASVADRAELRAELAAPLAVAVIGDMLGLTEIGFPVVLEWYRGIVAAVDAITRDPTSDVSPDVMCGLEDEVLRVAREQPASMLGSVRATAGLRDAELVANAAVLMFGAIETAEAMIANLLWHVLCRPEVVDTLRGDRDRRPAAVEESARLEPAAAVVDRYATADTVLGGVSIGAGDPVVVSLAGANRDPAVYPDPDRFDLDRAAPTPHLSFAHGPHACLGLHLARIEARAALDAVLDHRPLMALDSSATARPTGLVFRKPASVWVTIVR